MTHKMINVKRLLGVSLKGKKEQEQNKVCKINKLYGKPIYRKRRPDC